MDHSKLWKILQEIGIPEHLICLLRNLHMQVKNQQFKVNMEKQTGCKLGKEHAKVVYCHSIYLTSMQSSVQFSSAQSCPTLCDPMDCSLPGSSIHGIFQATVLEWIAISFYRGSFQPRDWTLVSRIVDRRFTIWATREVNHSKCWAWWSTGWNQDCQEKYQ